MATIRRVHPSSIANLFIRSILADIGELQGGFTSQHWQQTLEYFGHRCAYTGLLLKPEETDRDHAVPLNRTSGGLHVYGNLLPACRQANNEKGSLAYDVFLRSQPTRFASLKSLSAAQREEKITAIETFMAQAGYDQVEAQRPELLAYYAKKYALLQELCATTRLETSALMKGSLPAVALGEAGELDLLPLDEEQQDAEADLTDRLPATYQHLVAQHQGKPIGKLALALFKQLFADGRIEPFLGRLMDKNYSIQQLGSYVPVLAPQRELLSGQYRHYAQPLQRNGTAYFLGSQWNNERRAVLLDWLVDEVFGATTGFEPELPPLVPPAPAPTPSLPPATAHVSSDLVAKVRAIWSRVRDQHHESVDALNIGKALQQIFQLLDANAAAFGAIQQALAAGHDLKMGSELTVLRPYPNDQAIAALRQDSKGYDRYYAVPLARHQQLLSSQWGYAKHYAEWSRLFKAAGLL